MSRTNLGIFMNRAKQTTQAVKFLTYNREVLGSNLSRATEYSEVYSGCPKSLKKKTGKYLN
jgi:hypothetical protein